MPLWGNTEYASGNQKPVFANTSNATSSSTINGTVANTIAYYGNIVGISANEKSNSSGAGPKLTHAGWVSQKIGTGPISDVQIATRGAGLNTAGFIVVTDTSPHGQGASVNISYTIANTANLLQASSANSTLNGISTLTVVSGGSGYSNASQLTAKVSQSTNTTQPTFTFVLGGRGGRVAYETIVAMGSIASDDTRDNDFFPGT